MHKPLVHIDKASKVYGEVGSSQARVLKDISLTIQEGEFLIIYGPSGSGKSTMLNLLAGLEAPTTGRVLFHGRDLSHYTPDDLARYHRLKTGMIFQSFNLLKSLRCWENVALPLTASGIRYNPRKKRALSLMKQFGIDQYADRFPGEISGGEQQRLGIARALINHPHLILADEPTGNLDSASADTVMQAFKDIHATHKVAIVMVTHNSDHLAYGTRAAYMRDGVIIHENKEGETLDVSSFMMPNEEAL